MLRRLFKDTLQKNGRFSRTSLTMLSSYIIATGMAIYDLIVNGFNIQVFTIYIVLSTSMKGFDVITNKISDNSNKSDSDGLKQEEKTNLIGYMKNYNAKHI